MDTPAHPDPARDELVARVVAWHNRRALASRIDARHVTGIGVVALPFARAAGPARWLPRPLRRARALFTERLVKPLSASRLAAFAWRHGSTARPGPPDWPLRLATLDAAGPAAGTQWRHLRSAAIELGPCRIRVFVGGEGARAAVIGARCWSRSRLRRLLGAVAGSVLLSAGAAAAFWLLAVPDDGAAGGSSVASAAHVASAASATAPAAASNPAAQAAASDAVPDGEPERQAGSVAAGVETEATPGAAATEPAPGGAAAGSAAPAAPQHGRPAPQDRPSYFALATEPSRSRGAAQLRAAFINAPDEPRPGRAHVELMHTDAGWRAVLWPFPSREAAERARETLAARGVRVELIDF